VLRTLCGVPDHDDQELRLLRDRVQAVTHDLSNLLGIALNYTVFLAEDLAEAGAPDPIRAHLPRIEAATQRAVDLLESLRVEASGDSQG
jgi:signal transduction histidine kinase